MPVIASATGPRNHFEFHASSLSCVAVPLDKQVFRKNMEQLTDIPEALKKTFADLDATLAADRRTYVRVRHGALMEPTVCNGRMPVNGYVLAQR